ncbi:thiol:disulfide interchange protein [Terriglobus roseus DSM 18391]|uniref:Thiol:disulfide interchange protein n=2 Tax=Terriglobus roseus TaxID=392734 RepID=I3ZFA0_TERRK|nr:thiol:disulfide interchange protein [Terriglobus roseus DSM 18391]
MIKMILPRVLRLLPALLLALVLPSLHGQIGITVGNGGPGPVKAQHLTVEMISAGPQIAASGKQTVAFVFSMETGWHVYWRNAGFAGYPPRVKWTLPTGITTGDLQFPAPDRLPLDTTVDYGYEDSVAYPVTVEAAPKLKPDAKGNVHLTAKLDWLVCKEVCVPGKADLGLDLKLMPAGTQVSHDGETVGELGAALKSMPKPIPPAFKLTANSVGDNIYLTAVTGTNETDAEFYPMESDVIADAANVQAFGLADGAQIHMQRSPAAKTPPPTLHGLLKFSPEESYEITLPIVPGAPAFLAGGSTTPTDSGATKLTAVSAVALAFVGGMLLNLMPCVFPVLFLKALSLLQSSTEEKHRVRAHGVAYTLGIVASFWLVVAALLALRAGGKQFGWGFQLQSPGFVVVLAAFLFFFALSLSGMFELGLSLTSTGNALTRKTGYTGSFFTGVLATVVATPCVGPFMGAAIGFALAQPAVVTFLVFTSLALGLAAPYLALTLQPAWVRLLPKPGAWMEVLKQVTALPLFGFVIWLVYIYGRLFSGPNTGSDGILRMTLLLTCLLLIAIAAWALGRWPANRWSTIAAVLITIGALAIPLSASHEDATATVWKTFSAEEVQQARASGKAVFVDFTAAWCLSCQVNERVVLNSGEVKKQLQAPNVVPMRADWTQYDPKITAALQAVGRSGVPTYIIYPANPQAAPDVLPEVLSKSVVMDAMAKDLKR